MLHPHCFYIYDPFQSEDQAEIYSCIPNLSFVPKILPVCNFRKEFFYTSIDELEELVNKICPTSEFNKTMLAEEFRQSQSTSEVYLSDLKLDNQTEYEWLIKYEKPLLHGMEAALKT